MGHAPAPSGFGILFFLLFNAREHSESKICCVSIYTLPHEKRRAVFSIGRGINMADTKEEPPNSTADDSYGHVVDGVIFPPGVHPKISNRSIFAKEGPVDRADYVEREKELQEVISENISEIFRVQKVLSEREREHERQTRMLKRALAETSDRLEEKEKEGREAREKEDLGLSDYKAMMESKLFAADTRAVEAEEKLRKQTTHDASEEADRQRRPSALERLGILRNEKRRERESAKFNSDKLSEKMLALTVEVVLTRAEIAMILGKWLALEEYGKHASELAAELDFEPLSERCKFFEDIALMSLSARRQTPTPKVYDY